MSKSITARDLVGKRFGRLLVVAASPTSHRGTVTCLCDCGNTIQVFVSRISTGHKSSCGCFRDGRRQTPEYGVWCNIIQRCENPKSSHFEYYGGRGIGICQAWRKSFPTFLMDVGERPSPDHQIERIDTNKGYEPGNCRWATRKEQMNNTRRNRRLTLNGETLTVPQWNERLRFKHGVIFQRIRRGWSVERILTTPVKSDPSNPPPQSRSR